MALKIYFAGSIRGGRQDKEIYNKIISHLKQYGTILTEHVGSLDLTEKGDDGPDDRYIYDRDMRWLKSCDVVVAEVSTPSLGVGYEIAKAEDLNIDVLCLFRQKDKRLSAMIGGSPNLHIINYEGFEDAASGIDSFFRKYNIKKI